MKLLSLHIDNFGKFSDYDLDFKEGLNQIIKENGWGKSTLTAFIKVMFYGFDNSNKRDALENEKKHYKPWNNGLYGGSLTFESNNKKYTIYRTFQTKDRDDTFKLIDADTHLESSDYTSDIGKEIFSIDSDSFKKTLCIYENSCATQSTGDIEAMLGSDVSDTEDVNKYDGIMQNITDKLNALSPTRKTGELYKRKDVIENTKAKLNEIPKLEESIAETLSMIDKQKQINKELYDKKEDIQNKIKKTNRYNKAAGVLKQFDIFTSQKCDKQKAYENKQNEYGKMPDINEVMSYIKLADSILASHNKLQSMALSAGELARLDELAKLLRTITHDELKTEIHDIRQFEEIAREIDSLTERIKTYDADNPIEPVQKPSEYIYKLGYTIGLLIFLFGLFLPLFIVFRGLLMIGGFAFAAVCSYYYHKCLDKYNKYLEALDDKEQIAVDMKNHLEYLKTNYVYVQDDILDWYKYRNLEYHDKAAPYELAELDKKLTELEELKKQKSEYDEEFVQSNIENDFERFKQFITEYECEVGSSEDDISIYEPEKVVNFINEASAYLYQIKQNIEILNHLRSEYEAALKNLSGFENANPDLEQYRQMFKSVYNKDSVINAYGNILENDTEDSAEIVNINELNAMLDKVIADIDKCREMTEDYNKRLNSYQEHLDELSQLQLQLEDLQEEYDVLLANYKNLKLTKDFLNQARISFSMKYQAPVSKKFKEYIDICSLRDDNTSADYSMDVYNNLLKKEYGQEREVRFLSSGSKDIAGLCMRLAFIDAMYEGKAPFIIFDDPMVNMDSESIEGASRLIAMLSKRYQIIYFTCHNSRLISNI